MSVASVRAISECFIRPKCSIVEDDESKKTYYLGSFELLQMSHFYLQKGVLFHKLPPKKDDGGIKSEYLERLKQSLSSTLAYFYPLAGEFVTVIEEDIHKSFIYVDCNKSLGAKFIHAALDDVTVDAIASITYVPEIVQSLFDLGRIPRNYDAHKVPILVVQVTELVDGVFLGVSMNHSVVDGTTLWHFLSSWSEIFQSDDDTMVISRPPICERWFPEGHGPILKFPHIHPDEFIVKYNMERNNNLREAIFHLSSKAIASLKEKVNAECGMVNKISSFQVLSAAIWRSIVRARKRHLDEDCMCVIVANARSRMVPPLSQNYFGSFVVAYFNYLKASELVVDNTFEKVALSVHQKVEEITYEHLHDLFVGWIKSPFFAAVGAPSPNSVVISGTPREDACDIDFGLGKAVTIRTGSNKYDGKVVLHPGKEGRGSVSVQICLSQDALLALQHDQEFVSLLS